MTHLNAPAASADLRFLLAPVIARYGVWSMIADSLASRRARPATDISRLSDHLRRDIGLEPAERPLENVRF